MDQDHWKNKLKYTPHVEMAKAGLSEKMIALIDDQPCFGWLWLEEDGSACPEAAECDLAVRCRRVYELAAVVEAPQEEPPAQPLDALSSARTLKKKRRKNRGKWKGKEKYTRKGYEYLGRPVDDQLTAFLSGLKNPPTLDKSWNRSSEVRGLAVVSTASYHAVVYDGSVVARFYTNARTRAIVDIVSELIGSIKLWRDMCTDDEIHNLDDPFKPSEKSWEKVRPCTHRTRVKSEATANVLGQIICRKFDT